MILDCLKLEGVEGMTQADIKLLMILVGKAGGKPTHGCPFCSVRSPYKSDGKLYCLADLWRLHEDFCKSGADPKQQKYFDNVVNHPLLIGSPGVIVLSLLALPELHLLIGSVDKLLSSIEKNVFPSKEEGLAFMDGYLKQVFIIMLDIEYLIKIGISGYCNEDIIFKWTWRAP